MTYALVISTGGRICSTSAASRAPIIDSWRPIFWNELPSFAEKATDNDEKIELVGPVSAKLGSSFQKIGRHESIIGALLAAEVEQILPPVEITRAYVIVKLENRKDIDEVDWEVKREVIRKSLLSQRENEVLGAWVTELREKADIVDNRKYYF
jgi:hypothetical protein